MTNQYSLNILRQSVSVLTSDISFYMLSLKLNDYLNNCPSIFDKNQWFMEF